MQLKFFSGMLGDRIIDKKKVCREQINNKQSMTKQTKAAVSMAELSDANKKLSAKLIALLRDESLDPESRRSINRAINKARRGPNTASPSRKTEIREWVYDILQATFPHLEKREETA